MKMGVKKGYWIGFVLLLSILLGCQHDPQENPENALESLPNVSEEQASEQTSEESAIPTKEATDQYVGYKGPVQGEIKYVEGRPADENSYTRKASGDIGSPYHMDLIVTENYGHSHMYSENVGLVMDEVGMEVMFRNLDIQTAYGGGFVNAINGLESQFTFFTGSEREKRDWFYYVNGILAPVGVAEYRPQPDDVIWWDYHDWSTTMFVSSVIGSYPEPFLHGFWGKNPGTVIAYTPAYKEAAQELKQALLEQGVETVDCIGYDPQFIESPDRYMILLGTWDELVQGSEHLDKANQKSKLIGIYVEFDELGLHTIDHKGHVVNTYTSDAGAIYTFGSGIGSLKPLWLVTGVDDAGVQKALDLLVNEPSKIALCYGAVVTDEGVIKVPYLLEGE